MVVVDDGAILAEDTVAQDTVELAEGTGRRHAVGMKEGRRRATEAEASDLEAADRPGAGVRSHPDRAEVARPVASGSTRRCRQPDRL